MKTALRKLIADESGATAIEYGLIVCLIVIAASASFPSMSTWVNQVINTTADAIANSS